MLKEVCKQLTEALSAATNIAIDCYVQLFVSCPETHKLKGIWVSECFRWDCKLFVVHELPLC